MRTPRIRLSVMLVILIAGLTLAGCPKPTSTPTSTPPPPGPTASAGTPTPQGWVQHTSGDLTLWLPKEWEVLSLGQGDVQALFAEFQKNNPELAKIIGSADALQGVALWAFNTGQAGATFVDNLNIRRSPLNGEKVEKMQDVVNAVLDQYHQIGFEVGTSQADLQIGGHPAGRILYSFPVVGADGQQTKVNGHQYLVATPTDLWILSYSAAPGNDAALTPVFEQSAQSFKVK